MSSLGALEQAMASARDELRRDLGRWTEQLTALLARVRAAPGDTEGAQALERHVHRMRGTAGSLSCTELHEAAAALEQALRAARLAGAGVPSVDERPLIAAAAREAARATRARVFVARTPRVLMVDEDARSGAATAAILRTLGVVAIDVRDPRGIAELTPDATLVSARHGDAGRAAQVADQVRQALAAPAHPLAFVAGPSELTAIAPMVPRGNDVLALAALLRGWFADHGTEVIVAGAERERSLRLTAAFAEVGLRAHAATSADQVLAALDVPRPAALVLDLALPGLGGAELCRVLRATPEWRDLPVLLVGELAAADARGEEVVAATATPEVLVARLHGCLYTARARRRHRTGEPAA